MVVKYQVKGAIFACIYDKILDPLFEIFLGDVFGLSKVVVLSHNQYDVPKKDISLTSLLFGTYVLR